MDSRAPALMIEGLTVAAVGGVGSELGLCCAVPRAFTWGGVFSVVVMTEVEIRRVCLVCRGYELGAGWRSSRCHSTMQRH